MDKIKWCLHTKNGIELVEPNDDMTKAYLKKAEDSLRASASLKDNKDWEISSLYYIQYFGLYSILMKIGIKCEIHSCTISFMEYFLDKHFSEHDIKLIKKSMKARIDAQYYSDRNISDKTYQQMAISAPLFLAKCKHVLNEINESTIKQIRSDVKRCDN